MTWSTSAQRLDHVARALVGLCVLACTTAGAQEAPSASDKSAPAVGATQLYSCVDLNDALGRRSLQDQPCKAPMVHLPAARDPAALPRGPIHPSKSANDGAHPMFWRFPVQPIGPHEVPRHSWR